VISLPWKRRSLEQMLGLLAGCGIGFRAGAAADLLFHGMAAAERAEFIKKLEKNGIEALLATMGSEIIFAGNQMVDPPSDAVWYFDPEFIHRHAAYGMFVERLCRMTRGDVVCERAVDHVDVASGTGWVDVTLNGRQERLTLTVNDEWSDQKFFSFVQSKLKTAGSSRRLAGHKFAKDMLIVCMAPREIERLNRETSLNFAPLP
jgi:hypothetical protein